MLAAPPYRLLISQRNYNPLVGRGRPDFLDANLSVKALLDRP